MDDSEEVGKVWLSEWFGGAAGNDSSRESWSAKILRSRLNVSSSAEEDEEDE